MHKTFKVKAFGAGLAHGADFVNGKLARQDNTVGAEFFGLQQAFRMGEVGKGGKKKPALKTSLTRQIQHCQILHDKPVGPDLTGKARRQPIGLSRFVGFDQGIHGHVNARVFRMGKVCQA